MLRRLGLVLVLCVSVSVIGLPGVTLSTAYAASGPTPLVTQIADEPVRVSTAEFRRHLFVAADAARLSDPNNTADLLAERVLQHLYALNAQVDPQAAAAAVQVLLESASSVTGPAFDSRIATTMVLFQQAALADRGPVAATLQRATTEVVTLTAQQISSVAVSTHAENALGTTGDTESRLLASATFTPTAVLLDSATQADTNPRFASARDLVWGTVTAVSITATSAVLLADAPRLKDNADVKALADLRNGSGELNTTGGVIAGTPKDPAAHTIGDTMVKLNGALDATRQAAKDKSPVVAAQAVEDARDSQTTLALQAGFLTGGTSGEKDIVDQVGAAAVQATLLATAFSQFAAGTIGRAALSGNAIGVIMTLLPGVLDATGVFGPSSEDLVMTQLDTISQQMADFQNAVSGQFALVFENLSRVSAQLDDISQKLDRAVIDIEQARVQIGQVYDSLTRLQGSLDAVQNNILESLRNGTNSQLRQTISSTLGYADRNNSPLPLNDFNNAAAFLHTFATVTARHSPELNTDHPSFELQNDANQLSTGIATNVDFLDQVPAKRGWKAARLSGTTGDAPQLANVDDFVLASRAYAQLMLENTGYVSAGYLRWLSDIQQLGTPLARLTSAISTSDTDLGTRSTLLNHLVCARTSAAFTPVAEPACQAQSEDTTPVDTLVDQATTQLSGTFPGFDGSGKSTPSSPLTTGGSTTFNPFVNSSSDASDLSGLWAQLPGRDTVSRCGTATGETASALGAMDRPPSLTPAAQGVPQVFQWSDRMGLGTLDVCYKSTVRKVAVDACQYGADDDTDGWIALNVAIARPANCANSYWLKTDFNLQTGRYLKAEYVYDDIAFVWTFSPKDAPTAPIYVQSLVRRGAATATAGRSIANVALPRGGYSAIPGAVQQYSDTADYIQQPDGRWRLHTDAQRASLSTALTTADAVRKGWGDATTVTAGVASYQGHTGTINAGDPLDQAITGLDPKVGATQVGLDQGARSAKAAIDGKLVDLQGNVYRGLLRGTQTAGSTSSGPLQDALVRLDGANAMLGSFLQLGASKALRQGDLTSLPGDLTGAKALTTAIRAELAKTTTGMTGTAPSKLVTDTLDPKALTGLAGLLPLPGAAARRGAAASGTPVTVGPVNPALQSTNDQLSLTAVALGAPPSVTKPPTTTTPTPVPMPAATPALSPLPVVRIVLTDAWVSGARINERYKQRVSASGGTNVYSWSRRGRLPRGMSGKATATGRTYVVQGRPTKAGVYTFTLTATDAAGATTLKRYKIRVR